MVPSRTLVEQNFVPAGLAFDVYPFQTLEMGLPSASMVAPHTIPSAVAMTPNGLSPIARHAMPFVSATAYTKRI